MKSVLIKYIILYCFLFFETSGINAQTYQLKGNKICPKLPTCNEDLCKHYFNFHGVYISSYYSIIDSLKLIGYGKSLNYCIILSPITQEYGKDTLLCDRQRMGKRLLVLLKSKKNSCTIDLINENIIPKISEFQSDPFVKMTSSTDRLYLELFTGSRIKCTYSYCFFYTNGEYYLDNMKYNCYVSDLSAYDKKTIKFKKTQRNRLSEIDIHHYLYEPKL